jgi:hypothetical protein
MHSVGEALSLGGLRPMWLAAPLAVVGTIVGCLRFLGG